MNHDETASGTLSLTWEVDTGSLTYARFARLVVERGFTHFRSSSWPTEGTSFDAVLAPVLTTQRRYGQNYAIADLSDVVGDACVAHLMLQSERIYVDAAAHGVAAFAAAREAMRSWFPVSQPDETQR